MSKTKLLAIAVSWEERDLLNTAARSRGVDRGPMIREIALRVIKEHPELLDKFFGVEREVE